MAAELSNLLQAQSGINANKALRFNVSTGFGWREPKTGFCASVFPSDQTYHFLLDHNDYEIATNLFSIEGANLSDEEKSVYRNKVKDIVESSYEIKAWGSIYRDIIGIVVFIILIMICIGYNATFLTAILSIFTIICVIDMIYNYVMMSYHRGRGEEDWSNFTKRFSAAQDSGSTPQSILAGLKADEQTQREMEWKYQKAGVGNNISLNGTNVGAIALGTMIGNLMSGK